jgi:MOSC domain-containing protein YiiM
MKFVNSPIGRELCLRGINARVIKGGVIRIGETARKISSTDQTPEFAYQIQEQVQ